MKDKNVSGAALAASAVALIVAGAAPAAAEQPKRAEKPQTEKMACGGKNGCNAKAMESMGQGQDAARPAPAATDKKADDHK